MKKIFVIWAMSFIMAATACAHDVISRNINDLPVQARTTLSKHFAGTEMSYIKIDKEVFSTTYEVRLNNGMEVKFDSKGNWIEVDGNHRPVPDVFVPQQIKDAANGMFPGESIIQIEKDNRGWEIELSNDVNIKFDKKFRIREVD